MIERARQALARREARAALAARRPRPLPALRDRRVLLVLPDDEPGQRAAWRLVDGLDLPRDRIRPVLLGEHVGYVPDAYAGAIRVIGPADRDWRRLPAAAVRAEIWAHNPDVALSLAGPDDLGPALLVGASPAAVRVGRHRADREAFYDLMVGGEPDAAGAAEALGRLLRQLDPPVLPTR